MQITQIKEDISISYISALCAYAGIAYEIVGMMRIVQMAF